MSNRYTFPRHWTTPRTLRGVGLMEVLAAMFVLSVGLLGIASLQSHGIRAGHTASLRSVAVFKAHDIIERMRANPSGVVDGNGATSYSSLASDPGDDNRCDDAGADRALACAPNTLARHDIFRWKQSVQEMLPAPATGVINVDLGTSPPTVSVTLQWSERGEAQTYTATTQI